MCHHSLNVLGWCIRGKAAVGRFHVLLRAFLLFLGLHCTVSVMCGVESLATRSRAVRVTKKWLLPLGQVGGRGQELRHVGFEVHMQPITFLFELKVYFVGWRGPLASWSSIVNLKQEKIKEVNSLLRIPERCEGN